MLIIGGKERERPAVSGDAAEDDGAMGTLGKRLMAVLEELTPLQGTLQPRPHLLRPRAPQTGGKTCAVPAEPHPSARLTLSRLSRGQLPCPTVKAA